MQIGGRGEINLISPLCALLATPAIRESSLQVLNILVLITPRFVLSYLQFQNNMHNVIGISSLFRFSCVCSTHWQVCYTVPWPVHWRFWQQRWRVVVAMYDCSCYLCICIYWFYVSLSFGDYIRRMLKWKICYVCCMNAWCELQARSVYVVMLHGWCYFFATMLPWIL